MSLNIRRRFPLFSPQANLNRPAFGLADFAIGLGILALLYAISRVGAQALVKFNPPEVVPSVSLDPRNLPNYAARSTLRMFIALGFSTLFTFVYGEHRLVDEDGSVDQSNIGGNDGAERQLDHVALYQFGRR